MPAQFLLSRAAVLLRSARLVSGRSVSWPLKVQRDGRLRSRGLRVRLYGVGEAEDAHLLSARLNALLAGKHCRWRVVAIDGDGTLAIVVRLDRANLAAALLRDGLVGLRGWGSRPLRLAQDAAKRGRRGQWRFNDEWQAPVE